MSTDYTSPASPTPAATGAGGSDDAALITSINGADAGSVDTIAGSYEPVDSDVDHTDADALPASEGGRRRLTM